MLFSSFLPFLSHFLPFKNPLGKENQPTQLTHSLTHSLTHFYTHTHTHIYIYINFRLTHAEDKTALVAFASSTNVAGWNSNGRSGWINCADPTSSDCAISDPCVDQWECDMGSLCSTSNPTRVDKLHLGYNKLSGTIPPEIGKLTALTEVYVDYSLRIISPPPTPSQHHSNHKQ